MKKHLFLLLSALFLASSSALAYSFSAVAPSGQTLFYKIIDDNAMVTYPTMSTSNPWSGYTMPTGSLTIPSSVTHNGRTYSVTSIREYTFSGCSGLTSITIPHSVSSIGNYAFYGCINVDTLYYNAENCNSSSFSSSSGSSYDSYGFRPMKSSLSVLVIGGSVQNIPPAAFYGCNNVNTLYYNAKNCNSSSFSSSSGSSYDFYGFRPMKSSLSVLVIGGSVQNIPPAAFYGCNNVNTLYYNAENCNSSSFSSSSGSSYDSYGFRPMKNSLSILIIGDSVQTIPSAAFYDCSSITNLEVGNSVFSIGNHAFKNCSGLLSMRFKCYPPTIQSSTFANCPTNRPLYIPCGATSAYQNAPNWGVFSYLIEDCDDIITITSADNVTFTTSNGSILVSNAANQRIRIFDNLGRLISTTLNAEETSVFNMPASGVYLVQVGNAPAQRVVVVK